MTSRRLPRLLLRKVGGAARREPTVQALQAKKTERACRQGRVGRLQHGISFAAMNPGPVRTECWAGRVDVGAAWLTKG
jgi:hypothetical protein